MIKIIDFGHELEMYVDMMELLIISFSPLHVDSRVYRQLLFFKKHFQLDINITAAGYTDPNLEGIKFVKVKKNKAGMIEKIFSGIRLKLNHFEKYYWSDESVRDARVSLGGKHFDLIIANDINTLPLSISLANHTGAKVLIDCHEYTPREFDDRFKFNFFLKNYWDYICSTYLPKVDAATTVCKSIANEYEKKYGVSWQVITNAPFFEELTPTTVKNEEIRIIHHGGLNPTRKIETMINLIDRLDDRFKLDFMFVNSLPGYLSKLKKIAIKNSRVRFREPVPMADVVRTINSYDIGLYLLAPAGFNNLMALPNKFFDFIQARLAVVIWPSPEMSKITKAYGCGVVGDDFSVESMSKVLNALTSEDIMQYKYKSHKAALSLCAEKNGEILSRLVNTLLN